MLIEVLSTYFLWVKIFMRYFFSIIFLRILIDLYAMDIFDEINVTKVVSKLFTKVKNEFQYTGDKYFSILY